MGVVVFAQDVITKAHPKYTELESPEMGSQHQYLKYVPEVSLM